MSIRLSPTKVLTGVEAVALTTHRTSIGVDHADVAETERIMVPTLAMDSVNEVSAVIGGAAADEFAPLMAIVHLEDDGAAGGATGDMQVTMGITPGGTEVLGITATTALATLNDRFMIALTGLTATIPANSTLYVKATTRDTTAVGYTCDIYIIGQIFVSGT